MAFRSSSFGYLASAFLRPSVHWKHFHTRIKAFSSYFVEIKDCISKTSNTVNYILASQNGLENFKSMWMRLFEDLLGPDGSVYQIFNANFVKCSLQCVYTNMKDAFEIIRLKFTWRKKCIKFLNWLVLLNWLFRIGVCGLQFCWAQLSQSSTAFLTSNSMV